MTLFWTEEEELHGPRVENKQLVVMIGHHKNNTIVSLPNNGFSVTLSERGLGGLASPNNFLALHPENITLYYIAHGLCRRISHAYIRYTHIFPTSLYHGNDFKPSKIFILVVSTRA